MGKVGAWELRLWATELASSLGLVTSRASLGKWLPVPSLTFLINKMVITNLLSCRALRG